MTAALDDRLRAALEGIRVLPRRMQLGTPGVEATVPMLRGVWGAALYELSRAAYDAVFNPNQHQPTGRSPGYVLRPAPADPQCAPAVEWILLGAAVEWDEVLLRAWDVASGWGLGPERRRFYIRQVWGLTPGGERLDDSACWRLSQVRRPIEQLPPEMSSLATPSRAPAEACRLRFPAPLRLIRHKSLIAAPTLTDLIVAACRRIEALLPGDKRGSWPELAREAISRSREIPAQPWQGRPCDLHRYSGSQRRELELRGVSGHLDLPAGPGPLWPLLSAAGWLHVGKGTIVGLGRLQIERAGANPLLR